MSRREHKGSDSPLGTFQFLPGTASPSGTDRKAFRTAVSPRVTCRSRKNGGREPTAMYVEYMDERTHVCEGNIVAFQFVSKGKWMWAIGTVVSDSGTTSGNNTNPSVTDPGLVSLLCWKVTCDAREGVIEHGEGAVETPQERRGRISRELYVHDVVRREKIVEGIRDDIRRVSQDAWQELMGLKDAPRAVMRALQAVFTLLCIELVTSSESEEWDQMKRFMASSAFTDLLSDPNAVRMDDSLADTLSEKYLSDRLFDFTVVSANNRLAGLLQKWVTSEVYLHKARVSLRMIDDQLNDVVGTAGAKFSPSLRSGNSSGRTKPPVGRDDTGDMKVTVRSFSELGSISFVRTDDKVIVLQMSIFCKLVPLAGPLTAREMVLRRDTIAEIRSASSMRLRRTPQIPDGLGKASRGRHATDISFATHLKDPVHIFCNESIERFRLVARELGSLFDLHRMFAAERFQIVQHSPAHLRDRPNNLSSKVNDSERRLLRALKRINELEGYAKLMKDELQAMQDESTEEARNLKKQVRSRSDDSSERKSSRGCGMNFRVLCLLQDEELGRARMSMIESQERSRLLLQETRNSKNITIKDMKHDYVKETISLQREISGMEGCQQRAISILRDCLTRARDGHSTRRGFVDAEDFRMCLVDMEQAMMELGTSRLPSTRLLSERSDDFVDPPEPRAPIRKDAHTQTRELQLVNDVVSDNDVILIKDRLVEAMYDRELIQEMLSREQEKCRSLEKREETLQLDLERVANERTELDEEVQVLRAEVDALTKALKRATEAGKGKNGSDARRPSDRKGGADLTDGDDEPQTTDATDTVVTVRSANALHEQWLINLLDEEDVDYSCGVFDALCNYIGQLKETRAAVEADRDMHAAEAKMLEMCLKTAADALEDALLHDERWRPRTTSSQHTTFHSKKFPGDDWGLVVSNTPEALVNAIVHDVAAACHLPEDYVLDVDYRDNGVELHVAFDLRHDPSITTEEITRRLDECNFYEMEKIYANRHEHKGGVDELRRNLQAKVEEVNALRETLRALQAGGGGYSHTSM